MEFDIKKEQPSIIKVIGVGGGGSNAVNHMFRQGIKGVDFVICNTDAQALRVSPVGTKIQLGDSLTQGRGAGSIPEVGKNAAIENIEDIKKFLHDTKMVFITAGMGGGTGTGAAPIIAQAARELDILTVGIVTVPFDFEGKKRKIQADEGIEQLRKHVDSLIIVCNQRLREMYGNLELSRSFAHADDILTIAAKGIAEIITLTGYINVDFEDVKTAVKDSGRAIMGSAVAEGEDRATKAVKNALNSPLLNDDNIAGARYILLNIASGSREVTMDEIGEITDYVQDQAGLTADIIWGNCQDEALGEKLSVTLIATGFKTRQEQGQEAERTRKKVHTLNDVLPTEVKPESYASQNEMTEPVLLTPVEESKSEPAYLTPIPSNEAEKTFEFEVSQKKISNDSIESQAKSVTNDLAKSEASADKIVHNLKDQYSTDLVGEQFRKSRERIEKLKSMSYVIGNANAMADMENVPAYKRREVKLDSVPHSSESNVSRYTLSNEEDKKTELRQNNSFLHDNVD